VTLDSNRSSDPAEQRPRADILAEDYKGRYLWAEIDRLRARIKQLEGARDAAVRACNLAHDGRHAAEARIRQLEGERERATFAAKELAEAVTSMEARLEAVSRENERLAANIDAIARQVRREGYGALADRLVALADRTEEQG
jgi:cell division protein FtsB